MKIKVSTAFLLSIPLFAEIAIAPGGPIFENDRVRVMLALEKAHVKGKIHEHKLNRVMVYLQPGEQHFEYQDGRKPETFHWKAGQVVWSPANGTHQPEVTGNESFNILEVELKQAGTGKSVVTPLDPVRIDPKHYSIEFENDQVRVVRVRTGAGETAAMHEHATDRVSIYLAAQPIQIKSADGKTQQVEHKSGEAVWATPVTHEEKNMGSGPFEALLVELK